MNKHILWIILVFKVMEMPAQDMENYYQYTLDWTNINNAYVGVNQSVDWLLMSRSQYYRIPDSPKNILGLLQMGISDKLGLGLKVINDTRGVFGVTRFDGIYSQRFDLTNDSYLRFGISFGVLNSGLNPSRVSNAQALIDTNDPALSSSYYNYTRFTSGFGTVARIKGLELGISAPHLVISDNWRRPFLFVTASYEYAIPESPITLAPSLVVQHRPESYHVLDGFINIRWKQFVRVIGGYTTDNRLKLGLGLSYENFSVSYLNDNPIGARTIASNNSNEVLLTIRFNRRSREIPIMKSEVQKLIDETALLLAGDYDKDYLRKRIIEMNKQVDKLISKNSKATAKEVEKELNELEEQLELIIEKYNLSNE